jgi:hypothetical protein
MDLPSLPVTTGGGPKQLMGGIVQYPSYLFASSRAASDVEVTKTLETVINGYLSTDTTRGHVRKAGIKVVVMPRKPLLTMKHMVEIPSCNCHIGIGELRAGRGSFGDI